jgi:hypothetical protein
VTEADWERLRLIVREEIARANGAGPTASETVSKPELARLLRVSTRQIERFMTQGMPRSTVGRAPRFDYQACRAWLDQHGVPRSPAPEHRPASDACPILRPVGAARASRLFRRLGGIKN